jgi:hypothetical protein
LIGSVDSGVGDEQATSQSRSRQDDSANSWVIRMTL